jgi:hypothetical protein
VGGRGGARGGGGPYDAAATTGTGGQSAVDAPVTGGQPSADGSIAIDAGERCGGFAGTLCPTGKYCDIFDHCHMAGADFAGQCVPAGPDVICPDVDAPVCGCDGKTYENDCKRGAVKVQKFSDGPCAPGRDGSAATDPHALLSWGAAPGGARPGVVVSGLGYYAAGTDTPAITAYLELVGPTWSLTNTQVDDLFTRLAAVDFAALPHATSVSSTCKATLELYPCNTCSKKTLTYSSAAQLAPEMEPVWAWFDQLLGSPTIASNPRTYCSP